MTTNYDYVKHKVLFVDDEIKACKYFTRAFEDTFDIITCHNGAEAIELFTKHKNEIGMIVTDQRMPEMTGVELLDYTYREAPDIIKILSTAYSDMGAAVDAVNKGQIYKYVTKPWDISGLEANLRRGMEFFLLKKERDELLSSKLIGLERLIGVSRVITLIVAPSLEGRKKGGSKTSILGFLQLGYAIFEQLDLGFKNFFAKSKDCVGFYESYRRDNKARLESLVNVELPALPKRDIMITLAEILGADFTEDRLINTDRALLSGTLQGVFGFEATSAQTALANQVVPLILALGETGYTLSYNAEEEVIAVVETNVYQNSLEHFLDDELLLARIAGAL